MKVLIVDDNALYRMVLSEMLKGEGYEVATAGDGEEALSVFGRQQFDAVLLDVQMPKLDGIAVCSILKSQPESSGVPVLMVSGLSGPDDRRRCLAAGADAFLGKPVNSSELLARLAAILNSKLYTDEVA